MGVVPYRQCKKMRIIEKLLKLSFIFEHPECINKNFDQAVKLTNWIYDLKSNSEKTVIYAEY